MLQTDERTPSPALQAPSPPLPTGERDGARGRAARIFELRQAVRRTLIACQYQSLVASAATKAEFTPTRDSSRLGRSNTIYSAYRNAARGRRRGAIPHTAGLRIRCQIQRRPRRRHPVCPVAFAAAGGFLRRKAG